MRYEETMSQLDHEPEITLAQQYDLPLVILLPCPSAEVSALWREIEDAQQQLYRSLAIPPEYLGYKYG